MIRPTDLEALLVRTVRPVLADAFVRLEAHDGGRILTMSILPGAWIVTGFSFVMPARRGVPIFYASCHIEPLFLPEPWSISARVGPDRFPWSSQAWRLEVGDESRLMARLLQRIEGRRRECLENRATPAGFVEWMDPVIQDDPNETLEAAAYGYLLADRQDDCLRLLDLLSSDATAEPVPPIWQERASTMARAIREDSDMPKRQLLAWRDATLQTLKASAIDL